MLFVYRIEIECRLNTIVFLLSTQQPYLMRYNLPTFGMQHQWFLQAVKNRFLSSEIFLISKVFAWKFGDNLFLFSRFFLFFIHSVLYFPLTLPVDSESYHPFHCLWVQKIPFEFLVKEQTKAKKSFKKWCRSTANKCNEIQANILLNKLRFVAVMVIRQWWNISKASSCKY